MEKAIQSEPETQRLVLKYLDESNSQKVFDYLNKNKDFFRPWSPAFEDDFYRLDYIAKTLKDNHKLFAEEKEIRFFIFKKENHDQIIGDIGFTNIVKGAFLSCNLGYRMDKDEINKGYMAEALKAGIKDMFEKIMLHRIEANVIPSNKPSIRLMEKLGFENEGISKKYLKINGKWEDHIHFVILNESI